MTDATHTRWWGSPTSILEEPIAQVATEHFRQLMAKGEPAEVVAALEAVWSSLERSALWAASHHDEWNREPLSLAASTCLASVPSLVSHLRALATLGRVSLEHAPTALAAGRGAFEVGIRVAWIRAGGPPDEEELRALRLHQSLARWKEQVAARFDASGADGERWHAAARAHADLVSTRRSDVPGTLSKIPPIPAQLESIGLSRLYPGYQIASEHLHGGIAGGSEISVAREERSPYGTFKPSDWFLPVNLAAWGCLLLASHAPTDRPVNVGPVRGAIWASELLLLAP